MNEVIELNEQNEIAEVTEVEKPSIKRSKVLAIVLCIVIAIVSYVGAGNVATNPATYKATIRSIDQKKGAVMGITTLAAGASLALAAVPSDATTPIANEIMDVSSYLMIVVCALVLEKSLLTVFGGLAFKILIPAACLMFAISAFKNPHFWRILATKVAIFAMAIAFVVPVSLKVSELIYEANQSTVEELKDEMEGMNTEEVTSSSNKKDSKEEKSFWDTLKDAGKKVADGVTTAVTVAKDTAMNLLNKIIDAVALFIIAYCAIPVFIFILMGWLLKLLFGVKVPVPTKNPFQAIGRKAIGKVARGSEEE